MLFKQIRCKIEFIGDETKIFFLVENCVIQQIGVNCKLRLTTRIRL